MFAAREKPKVEPENDGNTNTPFIDDKLDKVAPSEEQKRRHNVLMECLDDEKDRQSEERMQAAIDEDFYDHMQWDREDAEQLMERGQAPLVFNSARQTLDWLVGTQKRMRKDYKILGVGKEDASGAGVVGQIVKQTDEANLTPWHQGKAFKQMAISGLSWLEEGVNMEPGEEIIFSGTEDWRNVYRDSRNRDIDLKGARYLFRRKVTDLDYAIALLPKAADTLRGASQTQDQIDDDDRWYLGERLTGASDITLNNAPLRMSDRGAFIGGGYIDNGRRSAVELLECWYRVPETVKVFDGGPLDGKTFNAHEPAHKQLQTDGWGMYETVRMRMRVMIATKDHPLWDGPSPFTHGQFLLIPVWGYRRYRDAMCYGVMRGMRDLQEDANKRASKALWLLSNNLIVADEGAVEDVEEMREEAQRADGVIIKRKNTDLRFEKRASEAQANLEMMDRNVQFMRDVGGVTNANLGRGASGQSGISVERQQDQGGLVTAELFDSLLLARKLAGRLRLAHIKQFKTKATILRIVGEGSPTEWLPINTPQEDGTMMNDLTAINADYVVAEQDYRESYVRAATAEMFEMLGKIAQFAPQVVLNVLDLAVDGSELRNKEEWVARIRALNGQRDPTKELTPEEAQAEQAKQAEAQEAKQVQREMVLAQLAELKKKVENLDVDLMGKRTQGLMNALQAAQIVATTPGSAPVADVIAQSAGFVDGHGTDPNIPAAAAQAIASVQATPSAAPPQEEGAAPGQPAAPAIP